MKQNNGQTPNNENLRVVIRVRPPMAREIRDGKFISTVQVAPDNLQLCIFDYHAIELVPDEDLEQYVSNPSNYTLHQFTFDYVYDQDSTQEQVYNTTAALSVDSTLQGYNSTIIAYGQTGTGKTYTMHGFSFNPNSDQLGIIPRSLHNIFNHIQMKSNSSTTFMVRASYLQIYNENINDLLRDSPTLNIREDKKRGVFVENLSEWAVRGPAEIYQLMRKGNAKRVTASTRMNDTSSRSHAVFIITVEQIEEKVEGKSAKVGKLNLVDLAGSERVRVTGATGQRLEESKKINQSLSALGNVIAALTENRGAKPHIPYRDSKITRLLEDSLGGNCKTTFMAMISPAIDAFGESLSTLKFANRAKTIKNTPIVNQDGDQGALLRKYQLEIQKLKQELEERSKQPLENLVNELEKEKQKALEDKQEAQSAYEQRSNDLFKETELRKQLEEKISALNSQMLVGGQKIEETPQFQSALEKQQRLIRQQYQEKLTELEKERQSIEEDKAQTDKYKQLLLKQRDIMIALTNRLNDRDETILQLQEELDVYEKLQKENEDQLHLKQIRLEQFEEIFLEHKIEIPLMLQNQKQNNKEKVVDIQNDLQIQKLESIPVQTLHTNQQVQSDALISYELKNQIEINKQLQFDMKLTRIELEKSKNEIEQLKIKQNQEQTTLIENARKSVDRILEQLTSEQSEQNLGNVAKELNQLQRMLKQGLQPIRNHVKGQYSFSKSTSDSPNKIVLINKQNDQMAKSTGQLVKLMQMKPQPKQNQSPVQSSKLKQKQKSVEDLWGQI
ncbi:unnamed protein product [Paramecium primaurelia]|uniref:Kinesin-like protein n=1 Tax=Paramecium primaurelia TaxID=5886 RepID=A0A8S1JNX8_PARPR|nr:unnamed protein product [Paramecium primaurelia]